MPERVWRFPSVSEPGVTRTVNLVNGQLVCDCPARHRCKHIEAVEAEIGFDFTARESPTTGGRYEVALPRLYTSAWWAYQPSMGVPLRITVGEPKDFEYEYDDGLRWCLAPFGRLLHMTGEEFEAAYRQHLDKIGVERIQQAIRQVARRHPEAEVATMLCWEATWQKPVWTCHRRVATAFLEERLGIEVPEWPPPRKSPPTTPHQSLLGGILDASVDPQAAPGDHQPSPTKKEDV